MSWTPPSSSLFPYTTLFRSCACASIIVKDALLPIFSSVVSLLAMFYILWRIDRTLAVLSLAVVPLMTWVQDRKSTRLNSSHTVISYAVFCLNIIHYY